MLFHPRADALSFFIPPLKMFKSDHDLSEFIEDVFLQLKIQEKKTLGKILKKTQPQIQKIIHNHSDKSHGFFISGDLLGYTILHHPVEAFSIINDTFHVRPILEELFINPEFILVNISMYDINIYRGDLHYLEIIQQFEFEKLPKNFNESNPKIYAPQYLGLVPYKNIMTLKIIAEKIKDMILYESLPVIVTGPNYIKSIFSSFFEDTLGVFSHFDDDFFEKNCVEILKECQKFRFVIIDYYSSRLKERLRRMMNSKYLLSDLNQISKAVYEQKVLHLVIPSEQKIWGQISPDSFEVSVHKNRIRLSVDILNELAEEVMRQGGRIHILGAHFFPQGSLIMAIIKGVV